MCLSLSQTSKNTSFKIISYVFSSAKWKNKRAEPEVGGRGRENVTHIMYMHVSKCNNDKNKIK
jgi:hypothetical protein